MINPSRTIFKITIFNAANRWVKNIYSSSCIYKWKTWNIYIIFNNFYGKVGYISSYSISVESTRAVDFLLLIRENVLQTAAPYKAVRTQAEFKGVDTVVSSTLSPPHGPFQAGTDIGWMAKTTSGTADVSIDFDIILKDVTW